GGTTAAPRRGAERRPGAGGRDHRPLQRRGGRLRGARPRGRRRGPARRALDRSPRRPTEDEDLRGRNPPRRHPRDAHRCELLHMLGRLGLPDLPEGDVL
ncbi:MAG: hypothetical protein AVDCRST_MAG19-4117, partial [uncultured Thermomicrobiales bacterium]